MVWLFLAGCALGLFIGTWLGMVLVCACVVSKATDASNFDGLSYHADFDVHD